MEQTTRGIRNNNPLNIKFVKRNKWTGRVPEEQKTDPLFEEFTDMVYGLRAAIVLLRRSYILSGYNTVRLIIKRWCPPGTEEKNNTTGYTRFVMERMRKAFPDMTQDTVMRWWEQDRIYRLVSAMAIMESGYKVTPELFGEAWQMLNK